MILAILIALGMAAILILLLWDWIVLSFPPPML